MDKFTDQYFTYRETPVDYDGVGNITRIKGNTLVWNQLVENGDFASATGWKSANTSYGTISVSDNILTYTVVNQQAGPYNYRVQQQNDDNLGIPVGHKLYIALDFKPSEANEGNVQLQSSVGALDIVALSFAGATPNVWSHLSTFYTTYRASQYIALYLKLNNPQTVGATFQFRNFMIIDLTKMFGSGNEPSSVSEFVELFSLPYYSYNSGSLLSFSGTGIKTVGKNLFQNNAVNTTLNGITFTINDDKSVTVNGTATGNAVLTRSNGLVVPNIKKGESLIWSGGLNRPSGQAYLQLVYIGDETGQTYSFVSVNSRSILINATENMTIDGVYLSCRSGNTFNNETFYPMLRYADADSTYEPYTTSTTSLPISTYFPTGMKSAGNVYDELTPSKAITRVGSVDLGSMNWSRLANGLFIGAVSGMAQNSSSADRNKGILSSLYMPSTTIQLNESMANMTMLKNNASIYIQNTAYTDATSFKTAMSGVLLYYELSAESEQDINTKMLYPIYANGTEQILPTSDTSPFFGDIEYYNGTEGETNIRKFWLINGNNERWDLTEKEFKAFLNNPQGLGFRKTVESVRYGERQNKVSETYNFPQPQGELLFYDSYNSTRYDKYNKFIRFLMNQPITLYYMIPVSYISGIANIYTLDCEVTEVQKTESKTDNILRSSIVFNGVEFYKGDPITVNGTGTSYTLTNDGDFPVGFEITVEGNLTNPYVTLSQDGELYGETKFDSETAFSSVYVNSNDGEQNVILEQGGAVIPNPLSYQDLSISNGSIYVTFVKLARGVSELSIGSESGTVSSVKIEFTPKYRSV